jgi:choline dehydrogenase
MPFGFSLLSESKKTNWCFETVPQHELHGRRGYEPAAGFSTGRVPSTPGSTPGGTPADYDRWAEAGATGWIRAHVERRAGPGYPAALRPRHRR